jgi:hypothetical protein
LLAIQPSSDPITHAKLELLVIGTETLKELETSLR